MITIYTDGACQGNPGQGGWGAILVDEDGNETIISGYKKYTTNNHMELLAVLQGLFLLSKPTSVLVVTDSKYVEESFMKKWYETWIEENQYERPNFELWRMLYNLKDIHDIKMKWVKGHAGHEYNERCDELATEAIKNIIGFSFEEKKTSESTKLTKHTMMNDNEEIDDFERLLNEELTFETIDRRSPESEKKLEEYNRLEKEFEEISGFKWEETPTNNIFERELYEEKAEENKPKKKKKTSKKNNPNTKYYYAVAKGRKVGIYYNWADCEKQVKNFSGGKFKKFNTYEEAENFIRNC